MMLEIFDLLTMSAQSYENRRVNVFYETEQFKTRVINLEPGGEIPQCVMASYVLFYVVSGEIKLSKNGEFAILKEHQVFITEPATLAMESENGARLLGIQIKAD
ncbi:MAG: hypothetical protein EOM03_05180 [Clostridia bacterium]|nr:hypothetical protein [Clostridia bacterium]NCC83503.1 hypothetical protein [Clostridia bacterium]